MSDLFGEQPPLRILIHVNLHRGGGRFDWDLMATNPETGDLHAMSAHPWRRRTNLGPELSRMLLEAQSVIREFEDTGGREGTPAPRLNPGDDAAE